MLRLRTFGSPALERDGTAAKGAGNQRKPLALLTCIAATEDRGQSRDTLLALLWPDTGPDQAPHRLNQALYALRRDLDAEDLILGSTRLRLNPAVITTDLGDFLAAEKAGDLEQVVALYRGPFLDGFHLRGAAEFDRWVEGERARLARICNEALEGLAAAAAGAGEHRQAALWWRRLADHDPFSSRVTLHLMHALAASGSRADALRVAQAYQQIMAEELEAAPSPSVVALVDRLRKQSTAGIGARRRSVTIVIAVLPLVPLGSDPSLSHLADGVTEELMSALARVGGVRIVGRTSVRELLGGGLEVRELGRRLEARAMLEGSVRQDGNRVRVTANLVDTTDGCRIWSDTCERVMESPFAVQDELARRIVEGMRGTIEALAGGDQAGESG